MAKASSRKSKSASRKPAKKGARKAVKKVAKKSAKKSVKKSVKKSAKTKPAKQAAKAARKAPKKTVKKTAKKAPKKAVAKKTAKQSAKKATKKPAKKAAKPAKKAATKAAKRGSKAAPAAKTAATPRRTTTGKGASRVTIERSATRIASKGVLIRLKRSGPGYTSDGKVKLRQVNATERSNGQTPITLHHRKPTKKEAEEFRQLLLVRRAQLLGDVKGLEAEAFSDETQHVSTNHLADSSFEQYEQEFNLSMIENETEELKEIARALEKMESGTFGECEACGIDISIERLRAMPYTRICIHCRGKFEEEGGGEEYGVFPERRI